MNTRKDQIKILATQIAAFCYAKAVIESDNGNLIISDDELKDYFYVKGFTLNDEELRHTVIEELEKYEGVAEVSFDDEDKCLDILLYLAYCPQNECDETFFSSDNYDELHDFEYEVE